MDDRVNELTYGLVWPLPETAMGLRGDGINTMHSRSRMAIDRGGWGSLGGGEGQ